MASVLPITIIVLFISLFFVPADNGLMLAFLIGSLFLIVGMALFSIGSEMSTDQIGNHIGAKLTKSRNIVLILAVSFILGVAITMAESDLTVLADSVPAIDKTVLIVAVKSSC